MNTSTIRIPNDLIQELNKRKPDVHESYADVITRLMVMDEDPVPLLEEKIAGIKEGLEGVNAGQLISAEYL
jgi:predicted CopG family antitoxin